VRVRPAWFLFGLCFLSAGIIAANKSDLVAAVKNLKAACGQPDFAQAPAIYPRAAKLIAYMGPDKTKKYQVPVNYTVEEEQKGVDSVCNRINNRIGDIHTWGEIQTRKKRGVTWHAISFRHTIKNKEKENLFAFVEIEGKLYLGDID
jgi:hypothetical protein